MALNSSGPISLAGTTAGVSIQVELGGTGTTQISLNDASVRTLAGVATGAITMPTNFYGKSNRVTRTLTIAATTQNYVLNTAKVTGYVAGGTDVTLTINAGVVVGSASTGSYAFTVNTSWAAGDTVTVVNNGYVVGAGGDGGAGSNGDSSGNDTTGGSGTSGGPAVLVQRTTSWTNTSGVCGGGGGGGGGSGATSTFNGAVYDTAGGAGGGGGRGYNGGSGGTLGLGGTNGSAGGAGNYLSAGSGGTGANQFGDQYSGNGGAGGDLGSAGSTANYGFGQDGQGFPGSGGAGGACLVGKSFVNGGAGITGGTTGGSQT